MRFTAALGVEVEAASCEATHFEHAEHDLCGQVDVGRELIGVPADELVATIGVDTAEHVGIVADGEFVLHRVSSQRGVVRLDVQFKAIHETVFAEEV